MEQDFIINAIKFVNLIKIEFDSISIAQDCVTLTYQKQDINITVDIRDMDIIISKVISNKYISSTRVLFTPIEFLSKSEIHKIEDFILHN